MHFIGLDIETAGSPEHPEYSLQPWRVKTGEARITAISVIGEDDKTYLSVLEPTIKQLRALFNSLLNEQVGTTLVGWNTAFDLSFLIAYGLEPLLRQLTWADAMIYRRALENHPEKPQRGEWGLKKAVRDFLPEYEGYEDDIKQRDDWSRVDESLLTYNRLDSFLTARLARKFYTDLNERLCVLCNVVCASLVPLASAWVSGIEINSENLDTWADKIDAERTRTLGELSTGFGLESSKTLTAHAKLKTWITQHGFPIECTDKTELTKFAGHELIDLVLAFKKAETARTKYIEGTRKSLEYNGGTTTHPQARLWNTYTGRDGYTSQQQKKFQVGVAIHQWPKRGDVAPRMVIQAPKGYLLAEYDFSTQESRLLADLSGDPVLTDIFIRGLDFHSYMASVITGTSYEDFFSAHSAGDKEAKEFRQCAKVVNLSLTYRASWRRLIDMARKDYDVIFTESQAREYHSLYKTTYARVPEYWQNAINRAQVGGFAETRAGRRVKITKWSREFAWASESTALNFPIQGTGADMKCLARGIIDPLLYQAGGRYMLDLHDALFLLFPDNSDALPLARKLKRLLSNLPYEQVYDWTPKVPMPVDCKIGRIWGSLEELK